MKDQVWKVLLVDDDEDDYVLTREMLSDLRRTKVILEWAPSYTAGQLALQTIQPDAVLVDYDLGARNGIDWIREAIARGSSSPMLMITGRGNYEVDLEAMEAGAVDYLTKSDLNAAFLERTVRYAIERKQTETALLHARDELEIRVEERSRELLTLNEELKAEVEERRIIEQTVRDREDLLRRILEILPVGVWVANEDGKIYQGNPAGLKIWSGARYVGREGYGEYKGWWLDTGEPIQPEEWAAARAITKGEAAINEEIEIEAFDGTRKIILNSAVPIFAQANKIAGAVIVNQDITALKRVEEDLRQSNALLENIFANIHLAIAYLDQTFNFIRVNRKYAQFYEQDEAYFVGKNLFKLYPDSEREDIFRSVVENGETFSVIDDPFVYAEHVERGISYWDWSLQPVKDPNGKVSGVLLTMLDVTERDWVMQLAEENVRVERLGPLFKLPENLSEFSEGMSPEVQKVIDTIQQYSQRQLYTVLETLPVGVWLSDAQGNIIYGNRAGQLIWSGASYVDPSRYGVYKGWRIDTGQLIGPGEWAVARAVKYGESSLNEIIEIECFDGNHKIIKNSAIPILDVDQNVLGVVVVNEDITDDYRAEEARRRESM